eukprot:g3178.t1
MSQSSPATDLLGPCPASCAAKEGLNLDKRVPAKWAANLEQVLFSEKQIASRVAELADEISAGTFIPIYYKRDGVEVVYAVGLLKGAFVVVPDLTRQLSLPTVVDFMAVSSYGNSTESSGAVKIKKDLGFDPVGKDILIIEDLIDTGGTLNYIKAYLLNKGARSVKIACLLSKTARRKKGVYVDYIGYDCPDYFVVGYGMDFAEEYRSLPFVGVLKEEAYKS